MTTVAASAPARPAVSAERRLKIAQFILCLIGLGIAGYLTYVHYEGLQVACTNTGCHTVQTSVYAKLGGIPVPVLGLVGYAGIFIALFLPGDLGRMGSFGLTLVGFLFSGYLTYRELFTIKAICEWCVGSAVTMTLLMIVATIRVVRAETAPR